MAQGEESQFVFAPDHHRITGEGIHWCLHSTHPPWYVNVYPIDLPYHPSCPQWHVCHPPPPLLLLPQCKPATPFVQPVLNTIIMAPLTSDGILIHKWFGGANFPPKYILCPFDKGEAVALIYATGEITVQDPVTCGKSCTKVWALTIPQSPWNHWWW